MLKIYVVNLTFSFNLLLMTLLNEHRIFNSYVADVFIKTDILLNVISGGSPYITVSARVGKYASMGKKSQISFGWFWILIEKCIDKTFESLDGKYHCKQSLFSALRNLRMMGIDSSEIVRGNKVIFVPLIIISLLICIPVYFILKLIVKLKINIKG